MMLENNKIHRCGLLVDLLLELFDQSEGIAFISTLIIMDRELFSTNIS